MAELCNPENYTGAEAHYADRSLFDWIIFHDEAVWFCDNCRLDIQEMIEQEDAQIA